MKKALLVILTAVVIPLTIGVSGCSDSYNYERPVNSLEGFDTNPSIVPEDEPETSEIVCIEVESAKIPISCNVEASTRSSLVDGESCDDEDKEAYDNAICLIEQLKWIIESDAFIKESYGEDKEVYTSVDLDEFDNVREEKISDCIDFLEAEPECVIVPAKKNQTRKVQETSNDEVE